MANIIRQIKLYKRYTYKIWPTLSDKLSYKLRVITKLPNTEQLSYIKDKLIK